jgi:hypothetical protein
MANAVHLFRIYYLWSRCKEFIDQPPSFPKALHRTQIRFASERQVMGREVVVAVSGGKLDFGPWEQIFYGEFDGGRRKRVLVKIIGE